MLEFPKLNLNKSLTTYENAKKIIPGAVLGIRRPYNFVEGEYPIYFESGKGGRVIDIDGNEYIDFLCAYGPIILGYREEEVDEAVIKQIRDKGFCFSLTQEYQNELASILKELIPCAEMTIFVKTGSDATTCAVRMARGYTGKTKILRCGYHGWHDWCVEVKGGVPEKLYEDVFEFHYNKLDELENLLKTHKDDTAAIIVTPYGHPTALPMQDPKDGFLEGVRKLADEYGVVLIFDEIRTGFRMSLGGAQKYYGVTPDLSTFGKAMANGYAIGALCGKREIMMKGEKDVFISSTFFPNSDSYVAALKTVEILRRDCVLDKMWNTGKDFYQKIQTVIDKHNLGARLSGTGLMFYITFDKTEDGIYKKRRNEFYTQLIRQGIFLQPYHHGYICYRHSQAELNRTLQAIDNAFLITKSKIG
ncbi:MAG: aspartate aminotransferase family protein [Alphaproteobacteria bacterium]